ncbi:carboxypeptidase-like regulatory domain-containing protein [Psychromonas sp. MME2]|uniref:carboxypeptidase-like regulatory domain-containing protein n=1 Tax=Psychromonas sp. MME2 TaxID=3231033 RepID=UPI00339CC306
MQDNSYEKVLNITSGNGWGGNNAVIAWGNEAQNVIDTSAYTHVKFKVKATNLTSVEVVVQNSRGEESKKSYAISSGKSLAGGWVEMEATLPGYVDMNWFALNINGIQPGLALLTDITFVTKDAPPPVIIDGPLYIFHSDHADSVYMQYWGDTSNSGTTISDAVQYPTYSKVLKLNSGTNWGNMAIILWGNEAANAVDISAYTHVKFKVKATTLDAIEVIVQNSADVESKIGYLISKGKPLADGWVEMEAALPGYTDMTWFGLTFNGAEPGSVLLADVEFVTQEIVVVGPDTAAPIPPQLSDSEALVLYSDSLKQDKFVSVWNSNWWNAPIYSEGNVDGDKYAKYEITDLGTTCGVVGLEFGIEYGVVDASAHNTFNFDMYVEPGVSKISVQLSSDAGNTFYELDNPITGQWISHETLFSEMTGAAGDLDASTLKFIGLQLWGEAGKAIYVDNIYFSGQSVFSDLAVTVKDSNSAVIPNAVVSVGSLAEASTKATTNANGIATLNIPEGDHKIFVDVEGMAIAKTVKSNVGGGVLDISMEPRYPAPAVAAPNPTIDNAAALTLYSDSLSVDKGISYWSDNWWNAPRFSEVKISGNNTASFQVLPDGVAGGVTGIQYGIVGGVVDASDKTGMRFDFYATAGVTKTEFQVVSGGGSGVTTLNSVTTGQWVTIDLVFADFAGTFDASTLSQLGLAIHGSTKDTVYLDNIYFY